MQQLHILQIIRGLDIGGDSGGAERFGVELSRALNRAGQKVTICAFFRVGTETEKLWQRKLEGEGIDSFFLTDWAGYNNLKQYFRGLLVLQKKLKGIKFDIVQSHFQLGSLTALLLKIFGKTKKALRTAHIRHEWELGKNGWLLNFVFMRHLFPIVLDAEVGVSQAVVDYLNTHPGVQISHRAPILIHNAVSFETKANRSEAPEVICDDQKGHSVISVGRLTEQKGYEYLLPAARNVLKELPDTKFFIVGEGELRAKLVSQAQALHIDPQVKFLGLRLDVPFLLPQCDLFVLSSLWEGFPTVIMESMVSETPVIATDIPGTRELIADGINGWLVKPRDSEGLASAIIFALTHAEQRKLIACEAKEHVKKFYIDNICEKYVSLYKNLLKENWPG